MGKLALSLADLFAPEKGASRTRIAALTRARNALTFALTGLKSEVSSQSISVDDLLQHRLEIGSMKIYSLVEKKDLKKRKVLDNFGPASLVILQEKLAQHRMRMQLFKVRRSWRGGDIRSERRVQGIFKPP